MGGKLTLTQMRVILLAGAVLLLVLAYFLGFQPNMDSASEYQVKTETAEKHIKELEALKSDVKNLEIFTSLYNDEIKDYINSFPVKMTQQKSVYLLYRMMINTEVDVTSITPGTESPFYYKGNVLTSDGDKAQAQADIAEDGYWGIAQTSQRLFDFASALAGDDVEKMQKMQQAMEKGFKQATAAWGKSLPEISQKTLEAANKLFED